MVANRESIKVRSTVEWVVCVDGLYVLLGVRRKNTFTEEALNMCRWWISWIEWEMKE